MRRSRRSSPRGRVVDVRAPTDGLPPPAAGKEVAADLVAPGPSHPGPTPRPLGIALGVAAAVPLVVGVLRFPLAWPVLAVLLALYGALPWVQPLACLLILPVLLPVLDLSPITGRLSLDAFDLTVLTTLAVGYARSGGAPPVTLAQRTLSACTREMLTKAIPGLNQLAPPEARLVGRSFQRLSADENGGPSLAHTGNALTSVSLEPHVTNSCGSMAGRVDEVGDGTPVAPRALDGTWQAVDINGTATGGWRVRYSYTGGTSYEWEVYRNRTNNGLGVGIC